jgi:hypothetical protein
VKMLPKLRALVRDFGFTTVHFLIFLQPYDI